MKAAIAKPGIFGDLELLAERDKATSGLMEKRSPGPD